jgi:hypothetical protein
MGQTGVHYGPPAADGKDPCQKQALGSLIVLAQQVLRLESTEFAVDFKEDSLAAGEGAEIAEFDHASQGNLAEFPGRFQLNDEVASLVLTCSQLAANFLAEALSLVGAEIALDMNMDCVVCARPIHGVHFPLPRLVSLLEVFG